MEIHAIYENGVFRPVTPVELPDRCEVELSVLPSRPTAADSPLAGIAKLAGEHSDNQNAPADLAEQHDHYLYGSPKRS